MIDRLAVVAHGRPAGEALADVVRAAKRAGGPLAPVTVVVPTNFAGLAGRRLLGSGLLGGGGVANVQFLTPFRLAELLAADRLAGRRPLTNPVLASAVRRALATDPGPFREVADHLATERALAALYGELSHLSPPALARVERSPGGARAVAVHRRIAAHLGAFYQEDDVAEVAASRPDLAAALAPFGTVVWHLPEPTTPALARFLSAALRAAPSAVVVGLTGRPEADAPVVRTCRQVGVAVPEGAGAGGDPPLAPHLVSVSDADEEVRAVVRRIAHLAAEGVPLDRIGVFHPTADPYARTLRQQLAAAGIPANGPAQERLADAAAGRTLLAALRLPAERWRRDRVLALVSGAPLRHQRRPARPAAWELVSRRAGVVQDLADWRRKLSGHLERLDAELADLDGDQQQPRARQLRRQRDDTTDLAGFVESLAVGIAAVDAARSWADKALAATSLLRSLVGGGGERQRWPEAEQAAAERVEEALARLAVLDDLEPEPTTEVFRRALADELEVRRGRHGRFGEGVVFGPLPAAVGQDLDAVFVLGLAEGTCPAPRRDDALLPEAARAAAGGELALRADALHDQHRWFLAALAAAPPERRWLLHPRGDLRGGRRRLPSRWLLPSASALAGRAVYSTDFEELAAPVVEVVPSFVAGLGQGPAAASAAERDLAALVAHAAAGGDPASHPAAAPVARGLAAQLARRSQHFTEWDGNLAGLPVPTPATGAVLSATTLERWASCGFRSLLADVLRLDDREDPERIVELGARDRGLLVHQVLERFVGEAIEQGSPDPDRPWSPEDRERLHAIAGEVCDRYERDGLTGRDLHWRLQREELFAQLDDFLAADDAYRREDRCRPARVELPFGMGGAAPVAVELPDGRQVRFRGKADRVDVGPGGRHLVVDYKTGKGRAYRGLDQDPVQGGTTLQLGLYAEAALQVLGAPAATSRYWLLDAAGPAQQLGYDWDQQRADRFREVVGLIVSGIEAGTFAAEPGGWDPFHRTHGNCRYCDFDRVCPVDRGDHAAAKAAAPQLEVRRRLRDQDASDGEDGT